jgi:glycosyltransferase involved in cell wall biosynthesis
MAPPSRASNDLALHRGTLEGRPGALALRVDRRLPRAERRRGAHDFDGRRLRVLLIAELCNPEWVSVPLVGWSDYAALSGLADVHLVTHVRNCENLLRAGLVEGEDFTAIDSGIIDRPMHRLSVLLGVPFGANKGWTTLMALATVSYQWFERLLWREFGPRILAGEFDVVHRITPLSPTTPSPIAAKVARAGVPFVLGPLNGGIPWPPGFGHLRAREKEWLSYVRGVHKLFPGYLSTRAAASALIAGSRYTRSEVPRRFAEKTVYVPENAIDPARFDAPVSGAAELPLRVAFVGRLVPYKGADMLLEAIAPLARAGRARVEVIGDGPEAGALREQAAREGIAGAVSFAGWVEHREIARRLAGNHVLGFPSVREFGGGVVLEAMALGLVPIVADYGGPGELVSPRTGFALRMGPRAALVPQLRDALERLASDPSAIRPMGERARARVMRSFTWSAKAAQLMEVYRWVLGCRERPDFGMPLSDPEHAGAH